MWKYFSARARQIQCDQIVRFSAQYLAVCEKMKHCPIAKILVKECTKFCQMTKIDDNLPNTLKISQSGKNSANLVALTLMPSFPIRYF